MAKSDDQYDLARPVFQLNLPLGCRLVPKATSYLSRPGWFT